MLQVNKQALTYFCNLQSQPRSTTKDLSTDPQKKKDQRFVTALDIHA